MRKKLTILLYTSLGHLGDDSVLSIKCTGTDNQTINIREKHTTRGGLSAQIALQLLFQRLSTNVTF